MKDYLVDLIQHTQGLGVVELIKVVGTDTETKIAGLATDRSLILFGDFKNPIPEFKGTFGMPNLSKLKTILGFEDYDDTSTINLVRETYDGQDHPASIHFETSNGDFVNDYRLMAKSVIEATVAPVKFNGATWDITFEPTNAGIQRLKKQAQANSEEVNFSTKVENNELKFFFGDKSSHSGNFVFQTNITGKLTKVWNLPVKVFLSVLDLDGDKTIRMSDQGVAEIVVDSGLAVYRYMIPCQGK